MSDTLKIVIPTAGLGTRMYPQTWSKPKPLVSVAGRTALDHLLAAFQSLPADMDVEYIFIVGPGLGEIHLPLFMKEHYPEYKAHFVLQAEMKGQSDAFWMAREYLTGPTLTCFSDTLIETGFSFLANERDEAVAWVKSVPDPRRFGVAEIDGEGRVAHLVEKPDKLDNHLVIVGCYYFPEGRELASALEEQLERGASLKGEYYLADAINIMLGRGLKMRAQTVEVWLDTGTIEATLETNRYLLGHGRANRTKHEKLANDVEIVPPVFIHASAEVSHSVIGPYASIGADCTITDSRVEDSILETGATLEAAALKGSFIGRQAQVRGRSAAASPMIVNIGDHSSILAA